MRLLKPILCPQRKCTRQISSMARTLLLTRRDVNVLDSHMSYLDTGGGPRTALFLHGNPTSSFVWREIIPHVQGVARCVAPDLIGMGHSGKVSSYSFIDHYRYLSAWIEKVDLPEKFTIVCQDWGSALVFHWTSNHAERVESLVHMESIVKPIEGWEQFPKLAREVFKKLRSPAGEQMVLQNNDFVEKLLPLGTMRQFTEEEMEAYRAPFLEPGEGRRPTLTWPRQIPIRGDGPSDVVDIADNYYKWLSQSDKLPKLYLHSNPGFFSEDIQKACEAWPNQRTASVDGIHFVQEDSPHEIGREIREFFWKVFGYR